jgi:hypothetical protein
VLHFLLYKRYPKGILFAPVGLLTLLCMYLINKTIDYQNKFILELEKQADDFAIKYSTTDELRDAMDFFMLDASNSGDKVHPPHQERYEKVKRAYDQREVKNVRNLL